MPVGFLNFAVLISFYYKLICYNKKLSVSDDFIVLFQAFPTFSSNLAILSLLKCTLSFYLQRVYFKLKQNRLSFTFILKLFYSHLMRILDIQDKMVVHNELFNFRVDFLLFYLSTVF